MVFHKLCSGFFPKFVMQASQYLLGNGVTLDKPVKDKLGPRFDKALQKMGMQALVDGVNWGFWNVDRLLIYRVTEFVPLLDEQTGDLAVGIRFYQIDPKKPMYVELFERDGFTKYKGDSKGKNLMAEKEKTAYVHTVREDKISTDIVDTDNHPVIPIFPLYANESRRSEFTRGIRGMIDAYDFINSDLADGITQIEGLYWIIKNFGGEEVAQLIEEIQAIKSTATDGKDSGAESHIVEIPYQAKKLALEILEKRLYDDFMALDTKALTGGSLTNVAINVAKTDLDLKTDIFEWQCAEFVSNVLSLLGVDDVEPKFKRRSLTNDTETIKNISTMKTDGYIDDEWAIENNPIIADVEQKVLLARITGKKLQAAGGAFPIGKPAADGGEEQQKGDAGSDEKTIRKADDG